MTERTFTSRIEAPAEAVFDWHERPGAFMRLAPPWAPIELEHFEGIRDGQRAIIRLGKSPFTLRWIAEHQDYVAGQQFTDVQRKGPFSHWAHTHRVEPDGPDAATLTDAITYRLPLGPLGKLVGGPILAKQLQAQFAYRHRITKQDLALHQHYNPSGRILRVAISGSSGLLGRNLSGFLTTGGHTVYRLVRRPTDAADAIYWNPKMGEVETEKIDGLDAVIHLAAENVSALRWTAVKKARIYDSRVQGTRVLAEALAQLADPPAFISASGIAYYGDGGTDVLTEESTPRSGGFLTDVAQAWEAAADPARAAGVRTVHLRIGVVLTPAGGALAKMVLPFKLGLGGPLGGKAQYFSWMALDDILGAIYHALWTPTLNGPINLTAPNPVTMPAFAKMLAHVLKRPALFPLPSAVIKGMMGEMGEEMLLTSARVHPQRLLDTGYTFRYPSLEGALRHQLGKTL